MLVRLLQPAKRESAMLVRPLGRTMPCKLLQPENAAFPIEVTLAGMTLPDCTAPFLVILDIVPEMLVKPLQFSKAPPSILIRVLGSSTRFRLVQP